MFLSVVVVWVKGNALEREHSFNFQFHVTDYRSTLPNSGFYNTNGGLRGRLGKGVFAWIKNLEC